MLVSSRYTASPARAPSAAALAGRRGPRQPVAVRTAYGAPADEHNAGAYQFASATDLASFVQIGDVPVRDVLRGEATVLDVKTGASDQRFVQMLPAGTGQEPKEHLAHFVGRSETRTVPSSKSSETHDNGSIRAEHFGTRRPVGRTVTARLRRAGSCSAG